MSTQFVKNISISTISVQSKQFKVKTIQYKYSFNFKKQFYFKQFSLASVHCLIVKNISISSYSVYLNSSNSANSV